MRSVKTATAFITFTILSLLVTSCQLKATTPPPPTQPPEGMGGGDIIPPPDETMAALGTQISMTQTAEAEAMGTQPPEWPTGTPIPPEGEGSGEISISGEIPFMPEATPTPPADASCVNPYTVKPNDWIYKIARLCRVEPSAIIAANPGINPDHIVPGQKLVMPPVGATAVPPATPMNCRGTYVVVQGENLFRIAYNCGLTTEELARVNGIAYPYIIMPGQVLQFPAP